jgi:PmbA protein
MRGDVDLVAPADRAASSLRRAGVDFFDVFAWFSRSLRTKVMGRGITDSSSVVDVGIGVRAFVNKGTGVASSEGLGSADIDEAVRKAVKFARVAQPDPFFKGMPGPSRATEVKGLCDERVVDLTPLEMGRFAEQMILAASEVRRGAMMEGSVSASYSRSYLVTSTGVNVDDERTSAYAYLSATYREPGDVGSSSEFEYGVSPSDIDFRVIGREAAKKAVEQFGSKRVESAMLPLIVVPDAASTLVFGLAGAISGEAVVKGRTFASGLLGEQVASDALTVVDDGTIPGAVGSDTYDGEGVPPRRLTVLEKGTLKEFLHNSYSAGIAGVQTNGHAQRAGHGTSVGAGPTNLRVAPGDSSLDEMIADTKRGVLVTGAMFYPNMVTGEFSTTVDEGFLIENGEKRHPVKNLMAGGHVLELYKRMDLISREGRTYGGGHFVPYVRISAVKLSGS